MSEWLGERGGGGLSAQQRECVPLDALQTHRTNPRTPLWAPIGLATFRGQAVRFGDNPILQSSDWEAVADAEDVGSVSFANDRKNNLALTVKITDASLIDAFFRNGPEMIQFRIRTMFRDGRGPFTNLDDRCGSAMWVCPCF